MRQLPVLEISSTDERLLEDEGLVSTCNRKKQLKSGKLRTAASLVVHRVVWAHELVYTAEGQPAVYDTMYHLSAPLRQWLHESNGSRKTCYQTPNGHPLGRAQV